MAIGDAITTIAYNFRMGVSTAQKIILDVCTVVWEVLSPIHIPVPSKDEWRRIAAESVELWIFFQIALGQLMADMSWYNVHMDHCSIMISFFSIVLLAVMSADYRIVMVDVSTYGSSNDSGGFEQYYSRWKWIALLFWTSPRNMTEKYRALSGKQTWRLSHSGRAH